jgi:predicted TPR repeat methyltransferase
VGAALAVLAGSALGLAQEPAPPDRLAPELIAAQLVARAVQADLKLAAGDGKAGPDDYFLATEMLRTALRLAPEDQTILRLALEAASASGDVERELQITRTLVKLDPLDTVSTLRLISANIARMQTAEARLAAFDRLLGPDGESLDDSVRSRLALDAALLQRERGDLDGFRSRLEQSLTLDPTNKDAAVLTLNLMLKEGKTPADKLDAALFVIYADPFDQDGYQAALGILLEHGAYEGAARMAGLSRRLMVLQEATPDGAARLRLDLADFNSAGPEVVISRLSESLAKARDQAKQARAALEREGKPLDGMLRPEEIRLPIGSDRVRVVAAAALDDRERAGTFIEELSASVRAQAEAAPGPDGRSEADAAAARRWAAGELAWLRLLAGIQTEQARTLIGEVRADPGADAALLARLDGWLALRSGELGTAERLLGEASRTDPLAVLGLAILSEQAGDVSLASARYRQVIERMPDQLAGAYARARYRSLTGEAPEAAGAARELDAIALGIPDWLESMVQTPRRAMALEVVPLRREIRPWERTPVRVTLRNNSPIPLGMGPGRAVDTRLLMAPSVDVGTRRLPAGDLLTVASIDRRLRLLPGESVSAIVWPDQGPLSSALELSGSAQTRVRWRVLQGFELVPGRGYEPCSHCLSADIATLVRRPSGQIDAVPEAVKYALQTRTGGELADSILSIVMKIATPELPPSALITPEDADVLMEILSRRFESMQKASRIIVQMTLPTLVNFPPALRLEQVIAFDTDEDVLAVQLVMRTTQADDPIFNAPAVASSPRLREIARAVRERLTQKRPSLSTMQLRILETVAPIPVLPLNTPIPLQLDQDRSGSLLPIAPDPRPVPNFF